MEVVVSTSSRVPIYRQIVDQVCEAVARGRVSSHERLPSVRELSHSLVVNPNTVARAYTELERSGVIYTRAGLGAFIAAGKPELTKKARRAKLIAAVDRVMVDAVRLGFSPAELTELVAERLRHFEWNHTEAKST